MELPGIEPAAELTAGVTTRSCYAAGATRRLEEQLIDDVGEAARGSAWRGARRAADVRSLSTCARQLDDHRPVPRSLELRAQRSHQVGDDVGGGPAAGAADRRPARPPARSGPPATTRPGPAAARPRRTGTPARSASTSRSTSARNTPAIKTMVSTDGQLSHTL